MARPPLAVGLVLAAALGLAGCGSSETPEPSGPPPAPVSASVELDAAGTPTADPFTAPAGADVAGLSSIATKVGSVVGDVPGLYAATAAPPPPCDRAALITRLHADSDRELAWTSARGIARSELEGHVNALTPAILRADTVVVDYRYRDGRAIPQPVVLQAGVAVLLDEEGVPAARCLTGDPLESAPNWDAAPTFQGNRWPGFRPTALWSVEPSDAAVARFVMADARYRGDPRGAGFFGVDRGAKGAPRPLPPDQRPGPVKAEHNWGWPGDQSSFEEERDSSPAPAADQPPADRLPGVAPAPSTAAPVRPGQSGSTSGTTGSTGSTGSSGGSASTGRGSTAPSASTGPRTGTSSGSTRSTAPKPAPGQ